MVPAGKTGVYEVPAGVVSIEATAFYGCDGITAFAANPKSGYAAEDGILYNSAKTILVSCPSGRTGTITIPSTVKHIGESAFQHSKASNIIIPNSVTSMGYCAFEYCENLKSITIPGSVKKISNAAFWECTNLRKVTIEKGVKRIKRNAFHGCVKLKKIVIPSTVKKIAKSAFSDCGDLTFYCKKSSAAMSYAVRRYFIDYKVI